MSCNLPVSSEREGDWLHSHLMTVLITPAFAVSVNLSVLPEEVLIEHYEPRTEVSPIGVKIKTRHIAFQDDDASLENRREEYATKVGHKRNSTPSAEHGLSEALLLGI
jgi:hypothetical protein